MLMTSVNWCGAEYKDVDPLGIVLGPKMHRVPEWKSSRNHWCQRKLLIHVRARHSGLASNGTILVLVCKTTTYGPWIMVFSATTIHPECLFFLSCDQKCKLAGSYGLCQWCDVTVVEKNNHNKQGLTVFFTVLWDKLLTVCEERSPVREHFFWVFYSAKSRWYNLNIEGLCIPSTWNTILSDILISCLKFMLNGPFKEQHWSHGLLCFHSWRITQARRRYSRGNVAFVRVFAWKVEPPLVSRVRLSQWVNSPSSKKSLSVTWKNHYCQVCCRGRHKELKPASSERVVCP